MWLRTRREGPPQALLVGTRTQIDRARSSFSEDLARARVVGEVTDADGLVGSLRDTDATDLVVLSSEFLDA